MRWHDLLSCGEGLELYHLTVENRRESGNMRKRQNPGETFTLEQPAIEVTKLVPRERHPSHLTAHQLLKGPPPLSAVTLGTSFLNEFWK